MKKFTLDELIFLALCTFAFTVIFSVTMVEAALLLALGLLLAKKYGERTLGDIRPALTGHPLFKPWLAYLGICLLTSLTAYYPLKGLGQLNSDLLKYVCLSALLLAVKKEHLSALSRFYIAGAALAALIGIAQAVHLFPSIYSGSTIRANAFMNAVRYAEVLTIAFALVMSRLLLPAAEGFRHERTFYKLAAVTLFAAIILSRTRGAYLGIFAVILAIFIFARQARPRLLVLAAIMLAGGLGAAVFNPGIKARLAAVVHTDRAPASFDSPSTGINIRLGLWKLGFKMFKAHPIVGVGPDNIKKVFKKFQPEQIGYFETWGSLHNIYIHQAAERGALGLAALLFLFGSMLLFALKRYRASKSAYALWALCALPAYYVMNLTEISFQHVHTSFAILLALAFAAAAEEEILSG